MESPGVVEALDEAEDFTLGFGRRPERPPVEEFALERREEALAHRVVGRVANRAHRLHDARLPAPLTERQRRVLRASVRMMDDRTLRLATSNCHRQRVADQFGQYPGLHRPADNPPAPGIEHHGEVKPSRPRAHLRVVGQPQLVGALGGRVAVHQVRRGPSLGVRLCRARFEARIRHAFDAQLPHPPCYPLAAHPLALGQVRASGRRYPLDDPRSPSAVAGNT